jgi:hypothetical protein
MKNNTIYFEDLLKIYSEETVEDIVEHWQNDIFTHPMTCLRHSDTVLKYKQGLLYCPEPNCWHTQNWMPKAVLSYWNEIEEGL